MCFEYNFSVLVFWVYFHCILSVSRWLVLYSVVMPIIECNCECTLVLYWRNVTKSVLKTPLNPNQPTKHWAIDKLPYYEECHSAFSASPQSFFSEVGAYEGWKESGFSYPQFFPVNFPIFLLLSVQHGVCRERHFAVQRAIRMIVSLSFFIWFCRESLLLWLIQVNNITV